jgi:hypothetical protein
LEKYERIKFSSESGVENIWLRSEPVKAMVSLFHLSPCIQQPAVFHAHAKPRWRSTMRELSAEARLHLHARSLSERTARKLHAAALYSAFAVIAAVIFGTLSYHPF